jgi:hypothetical protein
MTGDIKQMVEKGYAIPCGPMTVRADSVCRKALRDNFDDLLNRLSIEVSPEEKFEENLQGNGKLLQDISGKM